MEKEGLQEERKNKIHFNFTKQEVESIKSKIYLSELQERILEYKLKDYSIVEISMKENISTSTVSRQISKIKKKIIRVI